MSSPTVIMTNPNLPGDERAITSQEAFDQVWSGKGWELVEDEPAVQAAPEPTPPVDAPKSKPAQAPLTPPTIGA